MCLLGPLRLSLDVIGESAKAVARFIFVAWICNRFLAVPYQHRISEEMIMGFAQVLPLWCSRRLLILSNS